MQQIASEMNLSETVYIIDTKQTGFSSGLTSLSNIGLVEISKRERQSK
jgi:hypothetical protein